MRRFHHHKLISQGPPPAGFNDRSLRRAQGSSSQAVLLHLHPGRAGSRAAGAGPRPLPLEFPSRVDEPPVGPARRAEPGLRRGLFLAMPQRLPHDRLIIICLAADTGGAGAAVRWVRADPWGGDAGR